jgi:hypothetical protein
MKEGKFMNDFFVALVETSPRNYLLASTKSLFYLEAYGIERFGKKLKKIWSIRLSSKFL